MNFLPPRQGFYQESSSQTHGGAPPPPSPSAPPIQREHMFDKVVTPSDVGKLNRLVIPKQHAEKYFPLDSSAVDKGLLLNFEDRNGKPWRFRYSYWNSSQSYVMTKGWSRFVKEKKLDAGDVVSFQRGLGDLLKDRLFIDWRRRPEAPPDLLSHRHFSSTFHHRNPWGASFLMSDNYPYSQSFQHGANYQYQYHPYGSSIVNGNPCSIMYPRGGGVFAGDPQIPVQRNIMDHHQMVFDSVPVVQGKAAAKRFRLFGVNMDCPISGNESDNNECDVLVTSSSSSSLARLRRNDGTDKAKGSMSLDLEI